MKPTAMMTPANTSTPATDAQSCRARKSTFRSEGVACAATLHLPAAVDARPAPAVLMLHGWGGVGGALLMPFIAGFVAAGFAVMTFDYPGWGDSEGLPRNVINPWARVRTAESALAHLKSLPEVDQRRVVLWGTSFGGGHAVELAAEHPELLGVIAHVPMLDGRDAVKAVPLPRLLRFGLHAAADLLRPGRPHYIPVIAPPGEFGTMDRDGANDALLRGMEQVGLNYDNRIAARSVLTMGLYRPFRQLKRIRVPTLLVGATRDTVAPFIEERLRKLAGPQLQIRTLDANHFEPYFEPQLAGNLAWQLEFLGSLRQARANP